MVHEQCEDNLESACQGRHNKCKVALHVLERGSRALSHWNEEDDRQRTQEARHDLLIKARTTKAQVMQKC